MVKRFASALENGTGSADSKVNDQVLVENILRKKNKIRIMDDEGMFLLLHVMDEEWLGWEQCTSRNHKGLGTHFQNVDVQAQPHLVLIPETARMQSLATTSNELASLRNIFTPGQLHRLTKLLEKEAHEASKSIEDTPQNLMLIDKCCG